MGSQVPCSVWLEYHQVIGPMGTKRKNKDSSNQPAKKQCNPLKEEKAIVASYNFETLFLRFSHLSESILGKLSNENLVKCRKINKSWKQGIDNQKITWKRIIQSKTKSYDKFQNEWKRVFGKNPLDFFKELALAAQSFYEIPECKQYSPLHVTAGYGKPKLFKNVLSKFEDKNPISDVSWTPLHRAAKEGHLSIGNKTFIQNFPYQMVRLL